MPFYEYACTLCGKDTTILQKISDERAVICPACGQPGLVKQISAAGFRLKGGGWYETDFKSDNKKNLAGEGSNGAAASETKTTKTETAAAPAAAAAATPAPAAAATPAPTKPATPAAT